MTVLNSASRAARLLPTLLMIAGAASMLAGCQSLREAAGAAKVKPDEFEIVTKPPLVLPPDYRLRPPAPGQLGHDNNDSAEQTRMALYSSNPQVLAATLGSGFSDEEKFVLVYAGAVTADPNIRQTLATDAGYESQGNSFTDKILFWRSPEDPTAADVDPASEADRIRRSQATGQSPAPDAPPAPAATAPPAPLGTGSDH